MNKYLISFALLMVLLVGCKPKVDVETYHLATFTEAGHLRAVVEIPAGTNHKIEINPKTGYFEADSIENKVRVVDFLPYPGNYGFIPSTYMDPAKGGDGDALDILVLAEHQSTGSVMEVIPIATLLLSDNGELDTKIIAIPADPEKRIIKADNYQSFMVQYNPVKNMIQDWFLSYKGLGQMKLLGWRNDQHAITEIKKWQK